MTGVRGVTSQQNEECPFKRHLWGGGGVLLDGGITAGIFFLLTLVGSLISVRICRVSRLEVGAKGLGLGKGWGYGWG